MEEKKVEEKKETKPFRFNAKSIALTYSQCNEPIEAFKDAFTERVTEWLGISQLKIAREEHHETLGHHFHVAYRTIKKPDIKNPRAFDLTINGRVYHPNIKKMRSEWWANIYMSLSNKANTWEYGDMNFRVFSHQLGKRKQAFDDLQFTKRFVTKQSQREPVWPIRIDFPNGPIVIEQPEATNKKRHIWMYGPPDVGKTYFTEKAIGENTIAFFPGKTHAYDNYDGEQLIVYDDVRPTLTHLLQGCNTSLFAKPIGDTRYHHVYWPAKQSRQFIVLHNLNIDEAFSKASDDQRKALHARFIEIDLQAEMNSQM